MARQTDINEKMRAILVDWYNRDPSFSGFHFCRLIEVHKMFKLLPETYFLAVSIIDKYLEQVTVARNHLQLVGSL